MSALPQIPQPHYFYRSAGQPALEIVRPVLSSFNLVEVDKPHVYPNHQHLNYQLILVKRGSYRCCVNNIPLTLKPKDMLIVKRGDWHEDICALGLRYLAVNFDLASYGNAKADDIWFNPEVVPAQQVIRGPSRHIWEIVDRMQDESKRHDHFVSHFENALMVELFWSLVRALPSEYLSPIFLQRSAVQAFSERLRRLFDQHLTENISAAAMAAKLQVSVRTLTKRCQAGVGCPPGRAFMQYKMEYATRALRQSEMPIKEISNRLGFQNQYHFSRVFRRYLGTPPSNFRAMPK